MKFEDIVDFIGHDQASILCDRLGGSPVYVPIVPAKNSQLALCIGMECARILSSIMPGEQLVLPSKRSIQSKVDAAKMLDLITQGECSSDIAKKIGVSCRHVQRIKAKLNEQ